MPVLVVLIVYYYVFLFTTLTDGKLQNKNSHSMINMEIKEAIMNKTFDRLVYYTLDYFTNTLYSYLFTLCTYFYFAS